MLHTKFHRNLTTGSWKQDFLRINTIYGQGSHLGHVTSIMLINFHFLVPKNYIQNLVENGLVVSDKSKFQFLYYVNNLGPRSYLGQDMTLTFNTHFHLLNTLSVSAKFQATGCVVSQISTVFPFSYRKA